MPVALRGYTQGSKVAGGSGSVAWPSGTVAGDLALVHCGGSTPGPQTSGWTPCGHKSWWRILAAADIATPLTVKGTHVKLQTFSGASGVGRTSSQNGVTTTVDGAGFWLDAARQAASIAPAAGRLGSEWTDESSWTQAAYFVPQATAGWVALAGVASGTDCYSYEILPVGVPGTPTLIAPAEAERYDSTLTRTFAWRHESTLPQTGVRLRMTWIDPATTAPTTWWLSEPGQAPDSTSEIGIGSTAQSVVSRVPAVARGTHVTWAVATQTSAGWSPYSAPRTLYADYAPVVDTVTVSSPVGTLTPTVSWYAYGGLTGGVAASLTGWRVRVTPAASTGPDVGTLYDSGTIAGDLATLTVPGGTPWVNGQPVKAWVSVSQTGGTWSDPRASAAFGVSWTPPATPAVAASGAVSPPTVTVSGLVAGETVQIEQRLDGVTWTPLATRVATGASLGVSSPLAALGVPVAFRARRASVVDGALMWSAWSTVATVTAAPVGCMVVDDADRSLYLVAHLESISDMEMVQGMAVSYGLGAARARVDRTPEAGERGSLTWATSTAAEADELLAWLDAREVFWIVFPPEDDLAVRAKRVARVSVRGSERLAQLAIPQRRIPLSWVEQPQ